ncbi:MAG: alpha/beta hydrolase [Anaerolineae bacterium]|nr:alpha/beta hydrolase [Anaerolineae bacterium]
MKIYEFNHAPGKPLVNLAYANGFLPQTYIRALQPLFADYRVVSTHNRAMWDTRLPESFRSWRELGDDLLSMLDTLTDQSVVGMGHSFGGVATLYAAIKRPERFSRLILIDPTMLPPRTLWLIRIMRWLGLEDRFPLVQGTRRRRQKWDSVEAAYQSFRSKPVFARWPDDVLRAYAESMTAPDPAGGVRLIYTPEWEARFYRKIATDVWSLPSKVAHPMLVIRGELTDTFSADSAAKFQRLNPRAKMVTVQGAGHLVPQEKPEEVSRLIADFIWAG